MYSLRFKLQVVLTKLIEKYQKKNIYKIKQDLLDISWNIFFDTALICYNIFFINVKV